MSLIKEIKGDLLNMDVDIIVQQCNCLTTTALGLAKSISDQMQINVYSTRRRIKTTSNLSIKEDRSIPGTCELVKNTSELEPKYVACLFAQFAPGKPQTYHKNITKYHGFKDDKYERIMWFMESLNNLNNQIKNLLLSSDVLPQNISIAFPKYIGCGLAGGDWNDYYKMIVDFGQKTGYNIYIVEL